MILWVLFGFDATERGILTLEGMSGGLCPVTVLELFYLLYLHCPVFHAFMLETFQIFRLGSWPTCPILVVNGVFLCIR